MTTNNNRKEGGNCDNGKVADPDLEMVDLPGDVALQGFSSKSD